MDINDRYAPLIEIAPEDFVNVNKHPIFANIINTFLYPGFLGAFILLIIIVISSSIKSTLESHFNLYSLDYSIIWIVILFCTTIFGYFVDYYYLSIYPGGCAIPIERIYTKGLFITDILNQSLFAIGISMLIDWKNVNFYTLHNINSELKIFMVFIGLSYLLSCVWIYLYISDSIYTESNSSVHYLRINNRNFRVAICGKSSLMRKLWYSISADWYHFIPGSMLIITAIIIKNIYFLIVIAILMTVIRGYGFYYDLSDDEKLDKKTNGKGICPGCYTMLSR